MQLDLLKMEALDGDAPAYEYEKLYRTVTKWLANKTRYTPWYFAFWFRFIKYHVYHT